MGQPLHRSRACFVCGTENKSGLGLQPMKDGKRVYVDYTPAETYRGFSNAVHGGLTAMLLDEVIGHAAGLACNGKAATIELTITYKAPVRVGHPVRVEGWCSRKKGKLVYGQGRVIAAVGEDSGRVLAEAKGRFRALDEQLLERFTGRESPPPKRGESPRPQLAPTPVGR